MNPRAQSLIADLDLHPHPEGATIGRYSAPQAGCSREITAPSAAR